MGREKTGLRLGAFLYPTGYHVAAWRHPDTPADAGVNFRHFADLARTAERGCFDFLFLADSVAMRGTDMPALSRTAVRYVAQFEPLTLIGGLAALTERIGLTVSATTTYTEPFHLARMLASLDHMSGGRIGWNLVTSQNPAEAYNFGLEAHPPHGERYARAHEYADVVRGLWDSWDDDAFLRDKRSGLFFDPDKLHVLDHKGPHFSVRGPLNIPRSPQGRPVIIQAGSSEDGRTLAASVGEIIFTAQDTKAGAQAFYADMKARVTAEGRNPDEAIVMVGVLTYAGRTRAEAEDRVEALQALVDPIVGLSLLASELGGVDLSGCDPDGPLPPLPASNAGKSRQRLLVEMAEREDLTIRDLYRRVAGGRGHHQLVGSPEDIADSFEDWLADGAADGFMIMPPALPQGLDDFVALVVPELRRRGLVPDAYRGTTLRDHLGLPTPVSRYA
ncbi:MAG: LLM class flavin-dependent oxidoreductase [Alphaproteobacteria bacterium]|nr:LLM class flavin-dependent oxidoreductase [Alphaproteobacteria bacterium]